MKNKCKLSYWISILISASLGVSASAAFGGGSYSCYAMALPTQGHGGEAWAADLAIAKSMALDNCIKFASQTGGTPNTCKIVQASCNKKNFGEVVNPIDKSQ